MRINSPSVIHRNPWSLDNDAISIYAYVVTHAFCDDLSRKPLLDFDAFGPTQKNKLNLTAVAGMAYMVKYSPERMMGDYSG